MAAICRPRQAGIVLSIRSEDSSSDNSAANLEQSLSPTRIERLLLSVSRSRSEGPECFAANPTTKLKQPLDESEARPKTLARELTKTSPHADARQIDLQKTLDSRMKTQCSSAQMPHRSNMPMPARSSAGGAWFELKHQCSRSARNAAHKPPDATSRIGAGARRKARRRSRSGAKCAQKQAPDAATQSEAALNGERALTGARKVAHRAKLAMPSRPMKAGARRKAEDGARATTRICDKANRDAGGTKLKQALDKSEAKSEALAGELASARKMMSRPARLRSSAKMPHRSTPPMPAESRRS